MMRRSLVVLSALMLLAAALVSASAQGGQGRRGGGGGGLNLLRRESVQKELKMTADQVAKVDAKRQEVRQQTQALDQSLSPQERAEKSREIQQKAVADILNEDQMKRFHQLELQQEGPAALLHKDIADKLKLTDDQRKQIADIQQKSREDMRAALQGKNFRDLSDEDRQKLQEIRKTADEKMVAVLTDEQKDQWKDMQGEKFDFGPPPGRAGGAGA